MSWMEALLAWLFAAAPVRRLAALARLQAEAVIDDFRNPATGRAYSDIPADHLVFAERCLRGAHAWLNLAILIEARRLRRLSIRDLLRKAVLDPRLAARAPDADALLRCARDILRRIDRFEAAAERLAQRLSPSDAEARGAPTATPLPAVSTHARHTSQTRFAGADPTGGPWPPWPTGLIRAGPAPPSHALV